MATGVSEQLCFDRKTISARIIDPGGEAVEKPDPRRV